MSEYVLVTASVSQRVCWKWRLARLQGEVKCLVVLRELLSVRRRIRPTAAAADAALKQSAESAKEWIDGGAAQRTLLEPRYNTSGKKTDAENFIARPISSCARTYSTSSGTDLVVVGSQKCVSGRISIICEATIPLSPPLISASSQCFVRPFRCPD